MKGLAATIEFGGPDLPPRRLRDLLQAHVDASPAGSRIDWCTYYFRDRALAQALIRASDRGVRVKLVLEPNPRRTGANDTVIAMLQSHGLGGGFHLYHPTPDNAGHLHAKIYAFSHPNIAWIGSFNPSGDEPEDADVIAEIGDQDRGHNLLLGIRNRWIARALRNQVRRLAKWSDAPASRPPEFNRSVWFPGTCLYFYPRKSPNIVERCIKKMNSGDRLCGAISHLKAGKFTRNMEAAVKRGAEIQLLVHDTTRRVPSELVEQLQSSGLNIGRVCHEEDLPMHAKFLLIEQGRSRTAWIGSYNFNKMSKRHNAEILLRTDDPSIYAALEERFKAIAEMA